MNATRLDAIGGLGVYQDMGRPVEAHALLTAAWLAETPDGMFQRERKQRLPLSYAQEGGYVIGAPDLAVEIQSPSQSPADLEKKVRQYFAAGTHTV